MFIFISQNTIHPDVWNTGLGDLIRLGCLKVDIRRVLNKYKYKYKLTQDDMDLVLYTIQCCLNIFCKVGFKSQCNLTKLPMSSFYTILDDVFAYLLIKIEAKNFVKIVESSCQ